MERIAYISFALCFALCAAISIALDELGAEKTISIILELNPFKWGRKSSPQDFASLLSAIARLSQQPQPAPQENDPQCVITPHQQRVTDEKNELSDKIGKLETFLGGTIYNSLPHQEQSRLSRQYLIMQLYEQVLAERISAFQIP